MRNGERVMKKINITLVIALFCAVLFTACGDSNDTAEIQKPIEYGYGKVSISFTGEDAAKQTAAPAGGRTVLPPAAFDKYVYTFTKEGQAAGAVKTPGSDGFFTMEAGDYTVAVQAYTGTAEPYTLAASGVSEQFSISSGGSTKVLVPLSKAADPVNGKFTYTITFPAGASAAITLQKWSEPEDISLSPVDVPESEGNGKTQTIELEEGSYLFTVLISKTGFYAGISEAVHIYPVITTVYTKDINDDDLLVLIPPAYHHYNISGTGTFYYDGNIKTVTITPEENMSPGAVTVFYNGTETPPAGVGTYTVTFDVAAAPGFSAAAGLPAGTIIIEYRTPAVGHYNISGIGTFTYAPGTERTVSITRKESASPGEVTILYKGTATPPIDAGTYPVTFNVEAVPDLWNAASLSAGNIIINKAAGAAVGAPTALSVTSSSIMINEVAAPGNGQTVEYAKNTSNNAPSTGWQDGTEFSGLVGGTTYYIFARSKLNANYNAGAASASLREATPKGAGAAVGAPTLNTSTPTSITVNAVASGNGQTVEYARNTANTVPASGWQDSVTFSGLSIETAYYIFARSKGNANYETGTPSESLQVTTPGKYNGAAVSAPTLSWADNTSITINAVTPPSSGQTVEYARNTASSAPLSGWQDGLTFSGLTAGTYYYIFARSKENANYKAGAASSYLSVRVPTGNSKSDSIMLTANTWRDGVINTYDDEVWYSFSATAGTTYRVWLNDYRSGDGTKTFYALVTAYDSNGTRLFYDSDLWYPPATVVLNTSGTIYLRVTRASTYATTGTFAIAYGTSAIRPNLNATTLTTNVWTNGNLISGDDVWYSFSATAGTTYRVWLNDYRSGDGTKTFYALVTAYDSNGTRLFYDSDLWNSPATVVLNTSGMIYLRVTRASTYATTGTFAIAYGTGSTRP